MRVPLEIGRGVGRLIVQCNMIRPSGDSPPGRIGAKICARGPGTRAQHDKGAHNMSVEKHPVPEATAVRAEHKPAAGRAKRAGRC